jgi:hypothetical protein
MKATLEFNLPDDEYEFSLATNAREMWSALTDIQQDVRAIYKWENLDEREFAIVERIYSMINENVSNIKITQ